ncbi:hypothetical protein EV127DRAFT_345811 [Xylaria flabelliformis]|nr:hypothetical protein EV127DRAFT_345811 [Xylaria flabelliformis]
MTTADTLIYYPQYCFHLSPTVTEWCPLRAVDIAGLECRPGFQDNDVFFYLNHPIKWVRITGVVVAVDEYYGRRVYTIDDSTGQCIECTLTTPAAANDKKTHRDGDRGKQVEPQIARAKAIAETKTDDIDVGMVLDVKGFLKLFRGQKQINIHKATRVLTTNQEVLFWGKIRDFRRDVLSQPWVLKDKEVRRCRKLQQAEAAELEKKKRERPRRQVEGPGEGGGSNTGITSAPGVYQGPRNTVISDSAKAMKAQRTVRADILRSKTTDRGQFDALGL